MTTPAPPPRPPPVPGPAHLLTQHSAESLGSLLREHGLNPAHAVPILRSFYRRTDPLTGVGGRTETAEALRNFPPPNMGWRVEEFVSTLQHSSSRVSHSQTAADGTAKLLVAMADGQTVECVLMPSVRPGDAAACISSQVGCAMGCDFCASTVGGLVRSLQSHEIVEQFLHLRELATGQGRRLRTVVFMGMGEPLANLANVAAAVKCIADPNLGNLGWRQVTVSTVGLVPQMDALAAMDLNINLALSLHAPDDVTRQMLIPPNRRWPVAEVVGAAKRFYRQSGRYVMLQYTLIQGVNDSAAQAHALVELLAGFKCLVNVIPYNPTSAGEFGTGLSGRQYRRPEEAEIRAFTEILLAGGVVTRRRITRGDDADAACGQLRRRLTVLPS